MAILLWTLAGATLVVACMLLAVPTATLQRMAAAAPSRRRGLGAGALAVTAVLAVLAMRGGLVVPDSGSVTPSTAAAWPATAAGGDQRTALEIEAQTARRARDFPKAVAAFERLAQQGAMTADLWADYADAVGAARGGLADAEPQIRQALALDPQHSKALWLLGSLQTERRDFRGALATWQALLAVLPPESPDAKLVAANRDEAHAALGGGVTPATGTPVMPVGKPAAAQQMFVDERWLKRP